MSNRNIYLLKIGTVGTSGIVTYLPNKPEILNHFINTEDSTYGLVLLNPNDFWDGVDSDISSTDYDEGTNISSSYNTVTVGLDGKIYDYLKDPRGTTNDPFIPSGSGWNIYYASVSSLLLSWSEELGMVEFNILTIPSISNFNPNSPSELVVGTSYGYEDDSSTSTSDPDPVVTKTISSIIIDSMTLFNTNQLLYKVASISKNVTTIDTSNTLDPNKNYVIIDNSQVGSIGNGTYVVINSDGLISNKVTIKNNEISSYKGEEGKFIFTMDSSIYELVGDPTSQLVNDIVRDNDLVNYFNKLSSQLKMYQMPLNQRTYNDPKTRLVKIVGSTNTNSTKATLTDTTTTGDYFIFSENYYRSTSSNGFVAVDKSVVTDNKLIYNGNNTFNFIDGRFLNANNNYSIAVDVTNDKDKYISQYPILGTYLVQPPKSVTNLASNTSTNSKYALVERIGTYRSGNPKPSLTYTPDTTDKLVVVDYTQFNSTDDRFIAIDKDTLTTNSVKLNTRGEVTSINGVNSTFTPNNSNYRAYLVIGNIDKLSDLQYSFDTYPYTYNYFTIPPVSTEEILTLEPIGTIYNGVISSINTDTSKYLLTDGTIYQDYVLLPVGYKFRTRSRNERIQLNRSEYNQYLVELSKGSGNSLVVTRYLGNSITNINSVDNYVIYRDKDTVETIEPLPDIVAKKILLSKVGRIDKTTNKLMDKPYYLRNNVGVTYVAVDYMVEWLGHNSDYISVDESYKTSKSVGYDRSTRTITNSNNVLINDTTYLYEVVNQHYTVNDISIDPADQLVKGKYYLSEDSALLFPRSSYHYNYKTYQQSLPIDSYVFTYGFYNEPENNYVIFDTEDYGFRVGSEVVNHSYFYMSKGKTDKNVTHINNEPDSGGYISSTNTLLLYEESTLERVHFKKVDKVIDYSFDDISIHPMVVTNTPNSNGQVKYFSNRGKYLNRYISPFNPLVISNYGNQSIGIDEFNYQSLLVTTKGTKYVLPHTGRVVIDDEFLKLLPNLNIDEEGYHWPSCIVKVTLVIDPIHITDECHYLPVAISTITNIYSDGRNGYSYKYDNYNYYDQAIQYIDKLGIPHDKVKVLITVNYVGKDKVLTTKVGNTHKHYGKWLRIHPDHVKHFSSFSIYYSDSPTIIQLGTMMDEQSSTYKYPVVRLDDPNNGIIITNESDLTKIDDINKLLFSFYDNEVLLEGPNLSNVRILFNKDGTRGGLVLG